MCERQTPACSRVAEGSIAKQGALRSVSRCFRRTFERLPTTSRRTSVTDGLRGTPTAIAITLSDSVAGTCRRIEVPSDPSTCARSEFRVWDSGQDEFFSFMDQCLRRIIGFGVHTGRASMVSRSVGCSTGGGDYYLARHFALRADYREFVYERPDFDSPALDTGSTTHTASPPLESSLGFKPRLASIATRPKKDLGVRSAVSTKEPRHELTAKG
jgi:hypothetical protein